MIVDARRALPADVADVDVCIVGGGPAGISLAFRLERCGLSILLLESGGHRETERSRDLNRGASDPRDSHEPLEENRRRQWGGASAAWGGRCIPFDAIDFQKREWVDSSGWPLTRAELEPFYAQAMVLCEAGEMSFDAREALPAARELVPGLDGDGVVSHPLERWSPPTHFGTRYRKRLAASPRVRVLMNATCTHIQLGQGGDAVDHVVVRNHHGQSTRIRAGRFVLAAGGLETARILLTSNDVARSGVGNHSDCLGRYYQTHLFGCLTTVELEPGVTAHVAFDRDHDGVYCRRRIWFTPAQQEAARLLNTVFFLVRPPLGATGHRSALFSGVYLAKTLVAALRRPRQALRYLRTEQTSIAAHSAVLIRQFPSAIPEIYRAVVGRYIGSRRLPAVLPPDGLSVYHLQFQAEQVPNPHARVTLGEDVDEFGMRRLVVHPRTTAHDIESVIRCHGLLDERLRSAGLGRLRYDESDLRDAVVRSTEHVNSGAHHLGTTRMSDDPAFGVVDRDCRVHGVANLYVVGGSVMPTSGHANPTLTIVALALRLGEHLASTSAAR